MFSLSKVLRSPGIRVWSNAAFLQCQRLVQRQLHSQERYTTIAENPPSISAQKTTDDNATSTIPPGLLTLLKTFSNTEFQPQHGDFDWQSNASYVSSFNADVDKKTIYVPGSPPKWNVVDVPFTYKDANSQHKEAQSVDSLEVGEVELGSYFAALRHLCPTYDYSPVHIDCDWEVLESLSHIFPLASEKPYGTYGARRLALERIPATFTLHMVSNTLFIRRRPAPSISWERTCKERLRDFMQKAVTTDPDIPASARFIYSAEYELGPFRCVVHFSPDAWSPNEAVPRDTRPVQSIQHTSATAIDSNFEPRIQIRQAGEGASISDLMTLQAIPDGKGLEKFKGLSPKKAKAMVAKIERQKRKKAGPKLRARNFFSRIPATYRVTLNGEKGGYSIEGLDGKTPKEISKFCSSAIRHNNDLIPSEEEIEPLRRMFSLLAVLRETTESAKHKACVLELSKVNHVRMVEWDEPKTLREDTIRLAVNSEHENYEQFRIDIWEPQFDEETSRAHEVLKHCVPRKIVSDKDYHQFWIVNGDAAPQA